MAGGGGVRLLFAGERPEWVRVYECDTAGNASLLKDLRPVRENSEVSEYVDTAEGVAAKSGRIYLFWRARALRKAPARTIAVTAEGPASLGGCPTLAIATRSRLLGGRVSD